MNDPMQQLEHLASEVQKHYKPGQKITVTIGVSVSLMEIMKERWSVDKWLLMGPAKAVKIGKIVASKYQTILEKMNILDARDFIDEKIEESLPYPIDIKWKSHNVIDE